MLPARPVVDFIKLIDPFKVSLTRAKHLLLVLLHGIFRVPLVLNFLVNSILT